MATRKDIKAAAVEAAEQNREQAKARVEELAAMDPATRKAAKASDKAAAKAAKAADKAERKAARAQMTRKERRADKNSHALAAGRYPALDELLGKTERRIGDCPIDHCGTRAE